MRAGSTTFNFHQGIWERIIGAGDLDIEAAGQGRQSALRRRVAPDGGQTELYADGSQRQEARRLVERRRRALPPRRRPEPLPEQ